MHGIEITHHMAENHNKERDLRCSMAASTNTVRCFTLVLRTGWNQCNMDDDGSEGCVSPGVLIRVDTYRPGSGVALRSNRRRRSSEWIRTGLVVGWHYAATGEDEAQSGYGPAW